VQALVDPILKSHEAQQKIVPAPRGSPGYFQGSQFTPIAQPTVPPKAEPGVVYKTPDGVEHPVMATSDGKFTYNGQDVTADVTRPSPAAHLEAKSDMVIKGTTNVPSYDTATGKYTFDGKEVPPDQIVKAPPPKDPIAQALQAVNLATAQQNLSEKARRQTNVSKLADGMMSGGVPPDPEGLQRNGLYGDVVAELQDRGVNFSELRQNYLAQKRLIQTENSPQGVRLDIAVRSGKAMYDAVDKLADQWDGMGLGILSRANLKAASEGALGPAAQKLAVQLNGQIAQLTSDVATVEQNGMTPTNEARGVAEQSMQGWWGKGTIKAMTAQGRANMNIRDMARKETVPIVPGGQGATPSPIKMEWNADHTALVPAKQ
jgi:hypothetical protein